MSGASPGGGRPSGASLESVGDEAGRRPGRVLFVTDAYPPECGGSGWSTHALAVALEEAGIRVEVLEVDTRSGTGSERCFEGVHVRVHGTASSRRDPRRRLGARDFSFDSVARAVGARLRRDPPIDLVHGQHLHSGPPAAEAAASRAVGSVITLRDHWPVCLHGTHWWGGADCPGCTHANLVGCMREYLGFPRPLAHLLVPWARRRLRARRRGVARAHRVIAVSHTLRSRLGARMQGVGMRVIPNLVDPSRAARVAAAAVGRLPPGLPDTYLLVAGKINAAKGFGGLLEALAGASAAWPLVVAGTGPLEKEMERRAGELGLDVRFLGWMDHDTLLGLIGRARAVLLPSLLEEALSRMILESMALATPVIAWSTGSAREVIDSEANGWLIDEAGDLAAALKQLRDDDVFERVGGAALETALARFAPSAVLPDILSTYREAMDEAERR